MTTIAQDVDRVDVGRGAAALDLLLVGLASLGAHALEVGLSEAGLNPLPEMFSGLAAVLAGVAAAAWRVWARGQTWAGLGLRSPVRWSTIPLWVVGTLVGLVVVQNVGAWALGLPPPDLAKYDLLYGNLPLVLVSVVGVWFTAALPEELIYRGFGIDRLGRVFGGGRSATWAAALLHGLVFGLAHYQWGLGGVVLTGWMGAMLGTVYMLAGRNLWPLILAHGILDSLLITQLYFVRGSEVVTGG